MIKVIQSLVSKFFSLFLQAFLNHLVAQIGTTAQSVVAMANDLDARSDITGVEKAAILSSQLKSLAITKGKEVPNHIIDLTRQAAVTVLRGGLK
jgi:hypothetical protein